MKTNKFVRALKNASFFGFGNLLFLIFIMDGIINTTAFFCSLIIAILIFICHKIDVLIYRAKSDKQIKKEMEYSQWMISGILGAGFAYFSHESIIARWLSEMIS